MYQIKFSGLAELPSELDRNKNHTIIGEFEEVSRTETDLKDGTQMTTFKVKPVRLMKLEEGGAKIRLKAKNANSVRIRAAVFREQGKREQRVASGDSDLFYDVFADRLISNLPAVLDLLEM
jgi:hypothetical protein